MIQMQSPLWHPQPVILELCYHFIKMTISFHLSHPKQPQRLRTETPLAPVRVTSICHLHTLQPVQTLLTLMVYPMIHPASHLIRMQVYQLPWDRTTSPPTLALPRLPPHLFSLTFHHHTWDSMINKTFHPMHLILCRLSTPTTHTLTRHLTFINTTHLWLPSPLPLRLLFTINFHRHTIIINGRHLGWCLTLVHHTNTHTNNRLAPKPMFNSHHDLQWWRFMHRLAQTPLIDPLLTTPTEHQSHTPSTADHIPWKLIEEELSPERKHFGTVRLPLSTHTLGQWKDY